MYLQTLPYTYVGIILQFAYTIVLFINSNEKYVNFDMIIFQNAKLKFRDIIFYLSFR